MADRERKLRVKGSGLKGPGVVKGPGLKGPGVPKPPAKKRNASGDPDETLTVRQIVRGFGGSPGQWMELIRTGKLRGSKRRGSSEYRVRSRDLGAYVARAVVRRLNADVPPLPKIITVGGVAYIAGTSVPVRRLERARRAGSIEADLRAAFPDLPAKAMEAVADYVQRYPATVKAWAEELAPTVLPPGDQDDDGVGFDDELEDLLTSDAELFRRLAR
jgi:uncharacterized protein (DUF433 family)